MTYRLHDLRWRQHICSDDKPAARRRRPKLDAWNRWPFDRDTPTEEHRNPNPAIAWINIYRSTLCQQLYYVNRELGARRLFIYHRQYSCTVCSIRLTDLTFLRQDLVNKSNRTQARSKLPEAGFAGRCFSKNLGQTYETVHTQYRILSLSI